MGSGVCGLLGSALSLDGVKVSESLCGVLNELLLKVTCSPVCELPGPMPLKGVKPERLKCETPLVLKLPLRLSWKMASNWLFKTARLAV